MEIRNHTAGRFGRFAAAAVLTTVLMGGCTPARKGSNSGDRVPVVTVSLPPEAWLTEQIAGDRMEVNTLLPAGTNPETYDPTVGDIRSLAASGLFLISGSLEFEKRIASRLPESTSVADLSEGVELLYDTHSGHSHDRKGTGEEEDHHHSHGGQSAADPHIWSSPANARIIAANITAALTEADPDGEEYYRKNLELLTTRIDSLDGEFTRRLAPLKGRSFLIWHPSLSYMARDYGLRQQPLGMENKEQSVRALKAVVDTARASRPLVMLLQPEYDTPAASAMARDLEVGTAVINPLNPDWMQEMEATLDALTPDQ